MCINKKKTHVRGQPGKTKHPCISDVTTVQTLHANILKLCDEFNQPE